MASIRKRGNSYQITVSCGRDSQDKKIIRQTTYRPELYTAKGHPKTENAIMKEVNAYAADFERRVRSGQYAPGESLTFERYSLKYLSEYAEMCQAPATLVNTRRCIKMFVHDFGYMALSALNPLFLQEYVNTMQAAPKSPDKPDTLAHSTIRRRMAVLSAMLSQAVRWNLIQSNPMERVQILKGRSAPEQKKTMCFNQHQAETFLRILNEPLYYQYGSRIRRDSSGREYQVEGYQSGHGIKNQLKLFFYLAMFTGCRRGELIALEWSDLDFAKGSVSITKSACRIKGQTITKATKTKGSERMIAVPAAVMALARQWRTEQKRYRLSIGSQWCGDDYVFIQWNGSQMSVGTPYQAFHRIINSYNMQQEREERKLPLIPLHGLRHTAATLLISQGVDIRTVSGRLGHSDTSTTLNIYAEYLEELDRTASDKLEALLMPPGINSGSHSVAN